MTRRQADLILDSQVRLFKMGQIPAFRPPSPPPPVPCARPTWGRLIPVLIAIATLVGTIAAHAAGGR